MDKWPRRVESVGHAMILGGLAIIWTRAALDGVLTGKWAIANLDPFGTCIAAGFITGVALTAIPASAVNWIFNLLGFETDDHGQ